MAGISAGLKPGRWRPLPGLTVALYYALVQTLIELACVYPETDGPSVYIQRAFGPFWAGFIAVAVLVEFLLASPAIAASVGP